MPAGVAETPGSGDSQGLWEVGKSIFLAIRIYLLILEGDKRKKLRATVNSRRLFQLTGTNLRRNVANTGKFLRLFGGEDFQLYPDSSLLMKSQSPPE